MKRLLSIILAVLILCSVFVMPASAFTQLEKENHAEQFEQYLNDLGYSSQDGKWYDYYEVYEYRSQESTSSEPDWILAGGNLPAIKEATCNGIFGEYVLEVWNIYSPYELLYYIYVPSENKFYTLSDAWTKKINGIEKAFTEYLVPKGYAKRIEDTDGDGVITYIDAEKYNYAMTYYNSYDLEENCIYFDANTIDWKDCSNIYCHIWEVGSDSFFDWQSKQEFCVDDDKDGVWAYNLYRAGIQLEADKKYAVIFSNEKQEQTYHLELKDIHIGNTAYATDMWIEDHDNSYRVADWKTKQLHFDANTTDWNNYKKVYCHIWEYDGDSFFMWQQKAEACKDEDGDGIWTYDLTSKGIELEEGKLYGVIFSNENQLQTYNLLFDSTVLGDTAYADGKFDPYGDGINAYRVYWRNQDKTEFGPEMSINSIGQVTGTCIPKGLTAEDLFKKFLTEQLVNAQLYSGKTDQQLIDDLAKELDLTANEVQFAVEEVGLSSSELKWKKSESILPKSYITSPDEKDIYQVVKDYRKESGDDFDTKRYYFMMPNVIPAYIPETPPEDREESWTWYNKYAQSAYIFWEGTDRLDLEGVGNMAMVGDSYDVYYADVPDFVTSIEWNNGLAVNSVDDPMFLYAHKTQHIPCEYYEAGESELYPEGLDSFENMIFVLDENAKNFGNPVAEEQGEWYYYYGNECYGTVKNGDKYDCLNPYHYHIPQDTYIVAGVEKLCGSSWDVYDTNNKMTFNKETEAFEITYKDVPAGNHEFMVTKNYEFGPLLPSNPDYNEAKVSVDGSTVKIIYKEGISIEVIVTSPLVGDVDLDGVISIMDATEIQFAIAKKKDLTDEQKKFADTDGDGEISIMDATAIQLFVAKKITQFK